ncbi:TIGR01777 family oxidoreductase [Georgenia wangjunii]|uniref:TIGR01777 family oxidoreductase n=1 Tax=Georgenia wangjunii TaxID=3117730 RepID=UPI002F26AB51
MAPTPARRPRTVLMAGASGFLGSHLARHLRHRGDTVRRLVRRPAQESEEVTWDPGDGELPEHVLRDVDVVVNLGGVGIGDKRWTAEYKAEVIRSRTAGTSVLAEALAREADRRSTVGASAPRLLQASAVGYYGDRGAEVLTEESPAGEGFLPEVCLQWEAATAPAESAGVGVVHLRTGIVLAPGGGALGPLLPLIKAGLGGPLGGGEQWWPWITLADTVRVQLHLMDSALTGPVNVAGPQAAQQGDVIRAIARALRRPALLPVPGLAMRLALGDFADDVLSSQLVVPARLLADGFVFTQPTARAAADWVAERA